EIARHQHLHAVTVKSDQLAQERDGQQALPLLVFLLENDLRQHLAGNVLSGFGVMNDEILAFLHHGREVFESDISARAGVVEPPVGVFLDCDRFVRFGHAGQRSLVREVSIACFFWAGPPIYRSAVGLADPMLTRPASATRRRTDRPCARLTAVWPPPMD